MPIDLKEWRVQACLAVVLATSALVGPSPASAVIRGTSFYRVVEGPNWTQAETQSTVLGGHLIAIGSIDENNFIINQFNNLVVGDASTYYKWIGYTDQLQEGVWEWTNGESSAFTNWSGPNPSNTTDWTSPTGQDYAAIQWYGGSYVGDWDDKSDLAQYFSAKGIAEIPIAFSASQSASPIEGSGLFTTSLFFSAGIGSNLVNGETIYWGLDGISSDDLTSGSMSGFGVVTNGQLDITHSLLDDGLDDIENFIVTAYSDPILRTSDYQIGTYSAPVRSATSSTASVPGPIPLLALSSAFYWTRRLRKRIKNSKEILQIASAD